MLGSTLDVSPYLDRLQMELERAPVGEVHRLADSIFAAWEEGRFVFLFGNGGSATTASHMAEDLGKTCTPIGPSGERDGKRINGQRVEGHTAEDGAGDHTV